MSRGGARKGAGRKRKLGRQLCGFRLEVDTFERVKDIAQRRKISQSELVNELLKQTPLRRVGLPGKQVRDDLRVFRTANPELAGG
jgi:hypothetical protein